MCGIAGLVGIPAESALPLVEEAVRRLRHRGPDGEGFYRGVDVVLGMRRLAVIDVSGGDQPIFNEDRTLAVVCNGEIYNYVEQFAALRARGHRLQSGADVNVIPHLYEEVGADLVHGLRGMFAAALWDERRKRVVLIRDRAGKKPLYYSYSRRRETLAFASELPALLALLEGSPPLSMMALAVYLRLGFVPHPATIYEDVFALPPGCLLEYSRGAAPIVRPYWMPREVAPFQGTRVEALGRLDEHVREAVALRLRSDVPVGLFLSGGIDSGLVAAYAAELGARDLMCFVVEVPDEGLNEAPAARLVAERFGLPVEVIPLTLIPREAIERIPTLYGQPFGDSSAVPSYFVARAAARHRKVVLNGDGGDELFAGYRRYWLGRVAPWAVPLARPLGGSLRAIGTALGRITNRRSAGGFVARALRGLGAQEPDRYLIWTQDLLADRDVERCFPDLGALGAGSQVLDALGCARLRCHDLRSFQWTDFQLILADDLLSKMDIATMAHSVEGRSPLLDTQVTEFSWSLPERWLIGSTKTKPLLRALARARLPNAIRTAPKRGFEVPVARWLREDLSDVVSDVLLAADSRVVGLGDPGAIRALVRGTDAFAGNRPQVIWSLLMLELFLRSPTPGSAVSPVLG